VIVTPANSVAGTAAASRWVAQLAPGLVLAITVALAAGFVAAGYGAPVMLVALLIGVLLSGLAQNDTARPGLQFASRPVLQVGVALLGLHISFASVIDLGFSAVAMVVCGVAVSIGSGVLFARLLGRSTAFGILGGGATGICGASAALAITGALPPSPDRDREAALVVASVTTLSTICMVLYPAVGHLLGFNDRNLGIFFGATIHDVAQVVGAGYGVSKVSGDTATVVKLLRVALLLPSVFCIALAYARVSPATVGRTRLPVPLFAVAFAVFMAINSAGAVPAFVEEPLNRLSQACLVVAVAAIGLKTSIAEVLKLGRRAVLVPIGATIVLLVFVLSFQLLTA
jgi:uncharacterized integral membrane protein (TIGR00698 family)